MKARHEALQLRDGGWMPAGYAKEYGDHWVRIARAKYDSLRRCGNRVRKNGRETTRKGDWHGFQPEH